MLEECDLFRGHAKSADRPLFVLGLQGLEEETSVCMTTTAWIMMAVTWAVVVSITIRLFVMISRRNGKKGE